MLIDIIKEIPVSSRFVPSRLENVLNKKISNIALNVFEKMLHLFCSWLYYPYKRVFREKSARIQEEVPFIDCTREGIAKIKLDSGPRHLTLEGTRIRFLKEAPPPFSNLEYVAVYNDASFLHHFRIVEKKAESKEVAWAVNTKDKRQDSSGSYFQARSTL